MKRTEKYKALNAEMFHYENWVTTIDPENLKVTFKEILNISKFTLVNFTEHYFPIEGYTCVWVLAESHLAIHTFPKDNKSYIQISSCNKSKLDSFKQLVRQLNA